MTPNVAASDFRGSDRGASDPHRATAPGRPIRGARGYVSAAPAWVAIWAVLLLAGLVVPGASWLIAASILTLAGAAKFFAPLTAFVIGAVVVLYGSSGQASYLGLTTIRPETSTSALTIMAVMALGVFLSTSAGQRVERRAPRMISHRVWVTLAVFAIALLLLRFTSGIPVLAGDAGRLASVASVSPLVGLASGVLPIVVAFLPTPTSKLVTALKILITLLVVGTASRLLLAAVVIGFVVRSKAFQSARGLGPRLALAATVGVVALAVLRIYYVRTDTAIIESLSSRAIGVDGFVGYVNSVLGPSLFFAARNGLVAYEISEYGALVPPGGFIVGGLANALSIGSDPERWLTQALGLDVVTTGAVATPIWAGALRDFGLPGALIFALAAGVLMGLWLRTVPELTVWLAFGVVLSAYGSYLVSAQFVAASVILTGLIALFGRSSPQDAP